MFKLLSSPALSQALLVVIASKQDCDGALSPIVIAKQWNLQALKLNWLIQPSFNANGLSLCLQKISTMIGSLPPITKN